jgi:hypothetical protein
VGTVFARVFYTVSTLLFGPFRGLYNSPSPWCYTIWQPKSQLASKLPTIVQDGTVQVADIWHNPFLALTAKIVGIGSPYLGR